MPIYGYRCTQCGHELETLQNMSDPPLRACPECMGPLQKMLYPVGVHFKGSGFYSTDYNKGGGKASPNGTAEGGKSETKSESKPESKSGESKPKSSEKTD
jgi:putative FmdB family regulatory protein